MMRVLFFLLALISTAASAQNVPATLSTVPKTLGPPYAVPGNPSKPTPLESCNYDTTLYDTVVRLSSDPASPDFKIYRCTIVNTSGWNGYFRDSHGTLSCPSGVPKDDGSNYCQVKTCPSGYDGPMTIDGVPDMCRPAVKCEPSQINRDGVCVCDPAHLASFPTAYGGAMEGTGESPSSACVGGCMRNTGDFCLGGGDKWWCSGGSWTAQTCTGGPTDTKMPENKKPPCAATDGVLTSSKGTVACVPEGTPSARKPDVAKTEQKQTAADGTVTTTEKTTTKDPATGATTTTTSTTTTAPGGATSTATSETSSGSNGMFKGTGDNSGNEPGQCAKEPDSPMCKKGTVKEKGQFDSAQGAKLQEAKDQLTAKFNEIKLAASAAFTASTSSGSGTLPCPAPITVLGKPVSLCVSDYSNQLSVIGAIIVFAAGIIAILLVVTA